MAKDNAKVRRTERTRRDRIVDGPLFENLATNQTGDSRPAGNANDKHDDVDILTYQSGLILFKLDNQPSTHPECSPTYFAIATDVSDTAVNRMLSRLLTAYTTKSTVNIGFDNESDCGNGYIRAHRVG